MREFQITSLKFATWLVAALLTPSLPWAMSLDEVLIDSSEVMNVCEVIEGEHSVSIQPGVQYRMAGDGEAGIAIYGDPKKKQLQSFSCGGTKATVYYYEYGTKEELASRLASIKTILWGEKGPTKLHPELVLDIDNVLAVVSSRQPHFLALLLSHRTTFPDLQDSVVDERLRKLRCGSEKEASAEVCLALRDFKNGSVPTAIIRDEALLFGQAWEVSKDWRLNQPLFETIYVGHSEGENLVASFGAIEPENELERAQILMQIEAQRNGKVAESADPLLTFARGTFGNTKARTRQAGNRSLAFIGMGNRIYLRTLGDRLVLTTDPMHDAKERPFVVAAFELKATPR